ncbi:DUF982 domain-containing protein [Rhizobium sp. Root651]|uniref:DUF982 domain-containing protein n=1 Tax=Rhizobium sp. Root651 TaxID=1736577 RepID=UPI00138F1DB8
MVATVIPIDFSTFWHQPVIRELAGCPNVQVRGPRDALRYLAENITHQYGPCYSRARRQCHAALRNQITAEDMRCDFLAACVESDMRSR